MPDADSSRVYEATVAAIDREIAQLQQTKDGILRLMARSGQPAGDASPSSLVNNIPIAGDPIAAVREQEFAGMSVAKAAAAFLRKIGHHEKTTTIISAISKGGVKLGPNPESSVYTTLWRRPTFVFLGKSYWDLAERRPDLVQEKKNRPKPSVKRKVRQKREPKRVVRIADAPTAATG